MKKIYYFMLALILPTLALVSCGSDDDDALTKYNWGIYPAEEATTSLTWLQEKINDFTKNYNGKGSFDTDEPALAKYAEGNRALQQLKEEFDLYVETHDAGSKSFNYGYLYRVYKDGAILKESPKYAFEFNYTRNFRVEAKESITIDLMDAIEESMDGKVLLEKIDIADLNLTDAPGMNYEVHTDSILWVNANTLEFSDTNMFKTFDILENEKTDEHTLVMTYSFDKMPTADIKGDWYMLMPITFGNSNNNMTYDVKLPVRIK